MADSVVSFALENVGKILIEEGKLLSGVRDEVEEMQIELEWMQCFLRDAERRKGESYRVRNWVCQIRETTYDVEDLIEHFVLKSALRNRKGVVNRIKKYAFFINHLVELHQVGSRIEAIKARLTTLRTRLQIYGIKELKVGGEEVATGRRKMQDYSHVVDHNVVGLDEKIKELVERLIRVDDHDGHPVPASVVCLHGMGGVGKTTTAKKVYNDNRIRAYFEGFAWVYISQQCSPRQVWESILTQLSDSHKGAVKSMTDGELTSKLCGLQKEKRCLLVIDDIWNNQDWVDLSAAFPYMEEDSQSKMLVTTRNEGVVPNGVHVYRTKSSVLSPNNSLELLTNTILFLGGPEHPIKEDSNMKKHAEEMVKKCGGLPLAIIVLGGILATKHESQWEKVGANIKLVLKRGEQEGNERVMSVLESSYEDLPYNLRSCFLYFSQYQEDEEIKATELKQKWIAEGFVSSSVEEGDETVEDIAEEYLHELVRRCMIQVGRRGHTGRVNTCRIHDLMRDLCISKAKEEGFAHSVKLGAVNEGTNLKKVSFRRLCIPSGNHKFGESVVSSLGRISPQLRSIWFQDNLAKEAVSIVKKLKLVRVLEFSSTMWDLMGKRGRKRIGNHIHLRFLKLDVSKLPMEIPSIGNLICLQTLNLEKCDPYLKIPDSVWRMEQLRHLYLPQEGCVCESETQQVCYFQNLQTLVNFPPKNLDLEQNLVKFINVRKLVITNRCEEIFYILEHSPGMVFNRLESLSFMNSEEQVDTEAVTRTCPRLHRLVVIAPIKYSITFSSIINWPSNLTKLVLRYSGLGENLMRSLAKLHSLKVLFLYGEAFHGEQMIFHQNDFPQLQHLLLEDLHNLKAWTVQQGGLPSLSCLEIINCRGLKSVGDAAQYLKQLRELKIRHMPYKFRKRLEEGGEDWDIVKNVHSISFSDCYPGKESHKLDEKSSLELLHKTISSLGGTDLPIRENSEMDKSAIEMVRVCKGVKLAITILGRVLATRHDMKEWESIESVLREGEERGDDVFSSLLEFSYEDLPSNLKPCFLHFGQYGKDEKIKTSEMIQRWIGEGSVTSDDAGQEHLNELVRRDLIREVGRRSHRGRVTSYRMQEFVWHFCVSKAKEEGFELSLKFGADLTFLKVQEGSELPESFGNLRFLQTLNLETCGEDFIIPDSVWGMGQLRHLYLPKKGCECETNEQRVGDFPNLQTLVNFPPRDFDLQQNLVKFSNVRKLVITSNYKEMGSILRSQEIVFNRLESLSIKYDGEVDLEAFARGGCPCLYKLFVKGSIKFPTAQSCPAIWPYNITKLVLEGTCFDQSQLGSVAELQSLQVLFLQENAFAGKEMVFHTNDLPQLHHLRFANLELLETWAVHEGALSNLLCLEILSCDKLRSVPDGSQHLKQLKELNFLSMPRRSKMLLRERNNWAAAGPVPKISGFRQDY